MRIVAAAFSEIWHLFVDDGAFAAAIILWPGLLWLLNQRGELTGTIGNTVLAIGMIVILVAGAVRHRHPRGPR